MKLPLLLAHNYRESKVLYPCFIQPKLDGIRARYYKGDFYSRDGLKWNRAVVNHAFQELKPCISLMPDDILLDGEFYRHESFRGDHVSHINVNRLEPTDQTSQFKFHIFDFCRVGKETPHYSARYQILRNNQIPNLVDTYFCSNKENAEYLYENAVRNKYEGVIYRMCNLKYIDARSYKLLKRKKFMEEDFICCNVLEGEGRHKGRLGSIMCVTKDVKYFYVGGGFRDEERELYWERPELIVGKKVSVKFQEYSRDMIPTGNTVFLAIRNYE